MVTYAMTEVSLSIHLRHRELHGNLPQLFANVRDFHKLVIDNEDEKHAERISEILLWIATNHPEVLKDDSKLLSPYSVTNLCFRDSYEKLDNLIPTEALTTLLNSYICRKVEKFCGYIDPQVLNMESLEHVETMKLAVGRDNIHLFSPIPLVMNDFYDDQAIDFHLLCGELNQDDLALFPILPFYNGQTTIYISDVSDQDSDWILQAALAINRQKVDCMIKLIRSKLTTTGFEAIAKGFPKLEGGYSWSLGVSSYKIHAFDETLKYFERISQLYDMDCFYLSDMNLMSSLLLRGICG